jgi:hypothetical protein
MSSQGLRERKTYIWKLESEGVLIVAKGAFEI